MRFSIFDRVVQKVREEEVLPFVKKELQCLGHLFVDTEQARLRRQWQDRSTITQQLKQTLQEHQVCVLCGPQGVGKGTLAARYSQDVNVDRLVVWIDSSETKTGVLQALHTRSYLMAVQ